MRPDSNLAFQVKKQILSFSFSAFLFFSTIFTWSKSYPTCTTNSRWRKTKLEAVSNLANCSKQQHSPFKLLYLILLFNSAPTSKKFLISISRNSLSFSLYFSLFSKLCQMFCEKREKLPVLSGIKGERIYMLVHTRNR